MLTINGSEIKKALDLVQDRVQEQVAGILAKPSVQGPATGIFVVFATAEIPDTKSDFETVLKFLETGENQD